MASTQQQKIVQYLDEARAGELALVRVLQSQIAMAPTGSFRTGLETHLEETREHARLVGQRLGALRSGFDPVRLAVGVAEAVVGQAVALSKTPLDLVRGHGGAEQDLKNAKDAAATEALEIATYTAIVRLAERAGDEETAELARGILRQEQVMLERLLREIPTLTDAVLGHDGDDAPQGDEDRSTHPAGIGTPAKAAKTTKAKATDAAGAAKGAAKQAAASTKDTAEKTAAKATDAAGAAKGAAKDTAAKATEAAASAKDDAKATAAQAAKAAKDTATEAASSSSQDDGGTRASEEETPSVADGDAVEKPWPGYDELSVEEVRAVLLTADTELKANVGAYEGAHEGRAEILALVEPALDKA
jgi:ferritin-like metal-binding protein YciE